MSWIKTLAQRMEIDNEHWQSLQKGRTKYACLFK